MKGITSEITRALAYERLRRVSEKYTDLHGSFCDFMDEVHPMREHFIVCGGTPEEWRVLLLRLLQEQERMESGVT